MNPADQIRSMLEKAVKDKQDQKDAANFKQVADGLVKEIAGSISPDDVSNAVVDRLSKEIQPVLTQLLEKNGANNADITQAIREIQIHMPEMQMPEMKAPVVNIPAPIVNVPAPVVNMPEIKFPEQLPFPDEMRLKGISPRTPLHVQMVDPAGKPIQFSQPSGAVGGRGDFFTLKDIQNSSGGSVIDNDGNVKVAGSFSVTASNASTQLIDSSQNAVGTAANPINVAFAPSASQNINVFDGQASTITSHQDPSGDFRGLDITNLRTLNYVSSYNSTTATFTSGSVFTGLAEDIKDYSVVQVNVFSDVASATDGLSVQQSSDGTNWDITDLYTISAATGKTFSFQVAARYFRIVYTNGGTNQGAFRLQAVLHQTVSKNSSQRPGDGLSNENDFEQVSAYMAALNSSGNWDRLHTGGFDSLGALRTSQATDSVSSVVVNSGTITTVTSITNTVAAALVDSTGAQYSGSNPLIVDANDSLGQGDSTSAIRVIQAGDSVSSVVVNSGTITTVTSITNSTQSALIDSGGVQYSGSNPVPITVVSGTLTSTVAVGDSAARSADNGGNPIKVGGIARTTNPTAFADGDRSNFSSDKIGRQLTRSQARELIATAYVNLATGTETTLLAASAGSFLDMIAIIAANTSIVAQQLDIRATTAGSVIQTLYIPAQATAGWTPPTPWPQDNQGNNWTIDGPDNTNSNIIVSALFSKEI